MRWLQHKKRDTAFALASVALGVMAALFLQGLLYNAEAVLGGTGNLGTDTNNRHNFSYGSAGVRAVSESRICIFCHTPHTALDAGVLNTPLWNHELSSVVSYTVKSPLDSITNATVGNFTLLSTPPDLPDGSSKLCLSCHDGTVSVGAVYSRTTDITMESACFGTSGSEVSGLSGGMLTSACSAYIGTDLRNKHVVSIPMNQELVDASFANCTSQGGSATTHVKYPWSSPDARADTVLLRPLGSDKTFSSNPGIDRTEAISSGLPVSAQDNYKDGYYYGVQCSSCHDPHYWIEDVGGSKGDVAGEYFLVDTFNNLCKACHTTDLCNP